MFLMRKTSYRPLKLPDKPKTRSAAQLAKSSAESISTVNGTVKDVVLHITINLCVENFIVLAEFLNS